MRDDLQAPRLGFASVDITPTEPLPLAGYPDRRGPFVGIHDRLEVNLVAARAGDGDPILLLSIDTLFVDDTFRTRLAAAIGLDPARILAVATHTHNAPSLAVEVPGLGRVDPVYEGLVVRKVADAALEVLDRAQAGVLLSSASSPGRYAVNRRRAALVVDYPALKARRWPTPARRIVMATERRGFADNVLKLWSLETDAGQAVLWSVAAHPAFFPRRQHVSADFPGSVRTLLRQHLGAGTAILYVPGFAGSAVPAMPFSLPRSAKEALFKALPLWPRLPKFTGRSYAAYCERIAHDLRTALATSQAGEPLGSLSITSARSAPIFSGTDGRMVDLNLCALHVNAVLTIIAMSGEPVGEWLPELQLPDRAIATGYAAGRPLYIPVPAQLAEGGYEVEGFQEPFGLDGVFVPELKERVVGAVRGVAEATLEPAAS